MDNSPLPSIRKAGKKSFEDITESGGSDHGEDSEDRDLDNEQDYDPFHARKLTSKDLPDYDTDASRDSDSSTERDIKRRARADRKRVNKKSSPTSMQVNLTTGVQPKMFEKLNHSHAKAWVDIYVSLGPSGNSVNWSALIKPATRKQLGLFFAVETDDEGNPWVDADKPLSYLRWGPKKFIQRLLRAFPDDQVSAADVNSVTGRIAALPCTFKTEADFKSTNAFFTQVLEIVDDNYEDIDEPDTQSEICKLVLNKIKASQASQVGASADGRVCSVD